MWIRICQIFEKPGFGYGGKRQVRPVAMGIVAFFLLRNTYIHTYVYICMYVCVYSEAGKRLQYVYVCIPKQEKGYNTHGYWPNLC